MCADCRKAHLEEIRDFALTLRLLGEKLESGLECDDLSYIEAMEVGQVVVAGLLPILISAGPAWHHKALRERRRIVMSN